MKQILILVFTFICGTVSSQVVNNYEEIAFNFLRNDIISKEYPSVKKILFDNHIVTDSPGFSYCMPKAEEDTIPHQNIVPFVPDAKIKLKFSFFEKYFIATNKKATLFVFNAYPDKNNVIVCFVLYVKSYSIFYTIKINKLNHEILDYCKSELIS